MLTINAPSYIIYGFFLPPALKCNIKCNSRCHEIILQILQFPHKNVDRNPPHHSIFLIQPHLKTVKLPCGVFVLTHEGSSVIAGSSLHGAGAFGVACSKGFCHGSSGLPASITCPTQHKLQCGSLRKCLKWWQSLWDGQ